MQVFSAKSENRENMEVCFAHAFLIKNKPKVKLKLLIKYSKARVKRKTYVWKKTKSVFSVFIINFHQLFKRHVGATKSETKHC